MFLFHMGVLRGEPILPRGLDLFVGQFPAFRSCAGGGGRFGVSRLFMYTQGAKRPVHVPGCTHRTLSAMCMYRDVHTGR